MKDVFLKIDRSLTKNGIRADINLIKRHQSQGLMSKVFILDSSIGKLIVHINELSEEQRRQKIWQKISAIGKLLERYSQIPASKIIAADIVDSKHYFIIQTMLTGRVAGARTLKNREIVDIWFMPRDKIEIQIISTIKKINSVNIPGAGWLVVRNNKLVGMYKTWTKFLDKELTVWLKAISRKENDYKLSDQVLSFYKKIKLSLPADSHALVHNDLVNPGNILHLKNKLTGLVDWEWAMVGDPAWEYAFNNQYNLKSYSREFIKRTKLYEPLYLTWGLFAHAHDKNPKLYKLIKKHLLKSLRNHKNLD